MTYKINLYTEDDNGKLVKSDSILDKTDGYTTEEVLNLLSSLMYSSISNSIKGIIINKSNLMDTNDEQV